ncbi:MAG: PKD domain-containing protein, partial [Bdellovibrionales bacterium]|nr:PKD domain-containing protein [Bdellovibrionales bacterium]
MCILEKDGVKFSYLSKISGTGNLRVESGEELILSSNEVVEAGELELVSVNSSSFSRIKIEERSRFKVNSLYISSNDKSVIQEKVEIDAKEEVKIFSKYDLGRSYLDNVYIREGTKIKSPQIEIASNFIIGIGSNVKIDSDELVLNAKKCIFHPKAEINSKEKLGSCFLTSSTSSLFSINKNKGEAPLSVKFTLNNTKKFYQLYWDFGDGEKVVTKNSEFTHIYKSPGNYTARLLIQEKIGFLNFSRGGSVQVSVLEKSNLPPIAKVNCTSKDLTITCNANGSYDPEGMALSYEYDLGNGVKVISSDGNIVYSYSLPGVYTLSLKVVDTQGLASPAISNVIVSYPKIPPYAFFTQKSFDYKIASNVYFDASMSSDFDGSIVKFEWNLGDGNFQEGLTVNHKYSAAGDYLVILKVTDDHSNSSFYSQSIKILKNIAPQVDFKVSLDGKYAPLTAKFNGRDMVSDPDGLVVGYTWILDNSEIINTTEPFLEKSILTYGHHFIRLEVYDNNGDSNSIEKWFEIKQDFLPIAVLQIDKLKVEEFEVISFDASASHDPNNDSLTYHWDFGDGEIDNGIVSVHYFQFPGEYKIKLRVTDEKGNSAIEYKLIEVTPYTVKVDSKIEVNESEDGKIHGQLYVTAINSTTERGNIETYEWDFGDGAKLNDVSGYHYYETPGQYVIKLRVTNNLGVSKEASKTITVLDGNIKDESTDVKIELLGMEEKKF